MATFKIIFKNAVFWDVAPCGSSMAFLIVIAVKNLDLTKLRLLHDVDQKA
jgi:hypothetical protein